MMFRVLVGVVVCFWGISTYAATDSFIIDTAITGTDVTPPSVPANLEAVPVATTQIDLTWDASTDNVLVSGYQVFRDNAQIATTTLTSYSDAGLTENTLYTYYVTAFDSSDNVSASSTEVATTTLQTAPTSTPPIATPPGSAPRIELEPMPLEITSLEVTVSTTSATITWTTVGYVRSVLKWGKTYSFEEGSIAERTFRKEHETIITGLTPGTTYQFTIEGENHVGTYGILTVGTFTTLDEYEDLPPSNVSGLTARIVGDDVMLTWNNPHEPDLAGIKVLRSDRFYPSDTADGWIVYDDFGERAVDAGAATPGTVLYYTAFAYDEAGNTSSGAVIAVVIPGATGEDTPVPIAPSAYANDIALSFDDIQFIQDGRSLPIRDGAVTIDGSKQLEIALPRESVPEGLKSIVVTISHPVRPDETFSFLLRINSEGSAYTARIAAFGVPGEFPLIVSVYDHATRQVGYADGTLISSIIRFAKDEYWGSRVWEYITRDYFVLFVLILLMLLATAYRLISGTRR